MNKTKSKQEDIKGRETIALERVPPAPTNLSEPAADYWRKKGQELKAMGRLDKSILETLGIYCQLLADTDRMRASMDKALSDDFYLKIKRNYDNTCKLQLAYARELGLTPLSNKSIPEPKKADKRKGFDLTK